MSTEIGILHRTNLCIISDKHAGLLKYVPLIFPNAAHRHCLRHLRENFKRPLKSIGADKATDLLRLMYMAGCVDKPELYTDHMSEIQKIHPDAYQWLIDRISSKWSLVNDGDFRYGIMTTNASESFNSVLRIARGLPIRGVILSTYYRIISMFMKRREEAQKMINDARSPFVTRIRNIMHKYKRQVRHLPIPFRIDTYEFEVRDNQNRCFRVERLSEDKCKCSCMFPEIYHIPCLHIVAAFQSVKWSIDPYISRYYTIEFYQNTYAAAFHTIADESNWPQFDPSRGIVPLKEPERRRKKGRPRTSRIRNSMDSTQAEINRERSQRRCRLCKIIGHNFQTCP